MAWIWPSLDDHSKTLLHLFDNVCMLIHFGLTL